MSTKEQNHAEQLLVKAIFASKIPLRIMENSYWYDFLRLLRSSFALPTRHQVIKPLLDEVYNDVKEKVHMQITRASSAAIQCDGWSNIRREGIINFLIMTPKPVFYTTIATETNSHTEEYLANERCKGINFVEIDKVMAIYTDNAANTKKA